MAEHAPDRMWSGIDIPKTIAGVLAAVSAAVIGSFLGVAGTLVGAAVASLIGSVGTEIYHRSIDRGRKKIQGTFLAPAAVGTPPVEAAAEDKPSEPPAPSSIRWKRVAMVAGALFVLAMGTLTAAELVSGKSIADATGGSSGRSTTVGSVFSGKSDKSDKTPATTESTAPTSPTDQPTDQATTEPTQQATTEPTTDAPATDAPATEAPTGTTGDSGTTGDKSGADSGSVDGGGTGGGADTQNPTTDGTE
ncbi:hypothetical protein BJ973_009066 [Actinoplanes tereljensis]|uniref:Uncharacterized protein n=1 Tax=Paractinoplanes tereljensis TaxID=571912 RepID=A0A919NGZ4_9ACTN|nr:hypothetical protein [Actinoplanes tereljensis]GIF17970.1 hypothetical protein Ate02nite_07000 [Actinoplanes tereljensis]